ncbi:MAG: alpha/beta hydrolase [Eubacterium sp.]|nr:alpha/beta hydrolase [Eubacterium sp.]
MNFSEKLKAFNTTHPKKEIMVQGRTLHYRLSGPAARPVILCLNEFGISELWVDYTLALEKSFRVLTLDYPPEIQTSDVLCVALHELLGQLGVDQAILLGAGDGGVLAQRYGEAYPGDVQALVLMATATADCAYLEKLRRRAKTYFPILRRKISLMKPAKLIELTAQALGDETPGERAQIEDFLATVAETSDYKARLTQTARLAEDMLVRRPPVTSQALGYLSGRVLLLLPEVDLFDVSDQKRLEALFDRPVIQRIAGGHLSTIVKAEAYIESIENFLKELN